MHHKIKKIAAVVTGVSLMASLGCMSAAIDKTTQASRGENKVSAASSTVYDYKEWTLWTYRDKIVSDKISGSKVVEHGCWNTLQVHDNRDLDESHTYEISDTSTLEATVELGDGITKKCLKELVGGSVTYSKEHTETLTYTVPARTKLTVKKRMDSATTSYKSTVQLQHYLILAGKWYDEGDPSDEISNRTEKYPAFKYVKTKKKK